jgi:hypothetical protein
VSCPTHKVPMRTHNRSDGTTREVCPECQAAYRRRRRAERVTLAWRRLATMRRPVL